MRSMFKIVLWKVHSHADTSGSCRLLPLLAAYSVTCGAPRYASGPPKVVSEKQRALEALARRILPFPDGNFSPSPPPALLDAITDELLVVTADVVAAVAAEVAPRPSGKALLRLLAWVVADARGATVALEKVLAETVGKRLDRQAQKVRAELARATRDAEASRNVLLASTGSEELADRAAVAAQLVAIDAAERQAYEHAHNEVYVGFHELEGLLPGYVAPPRYPELVSLHEPQGPTSLPPIPPDLRAALGAAACEEMWARALADGGYHGLDPTDGDFWWAVFLPSFVNGLRGERDREQQRASKMEELAVREAHEREEAFTRWEASIKRVVAAGEEAARVEKSRVMAECAAVESEHRDEVSAASERAREYAQQLDEANERVVTLQQEMARVCGREEALKGVIERMIERYGMWLAHEPRA